jgi:cytochrome c551/c552
MEPHGDGALNDAKLQTILQTLLTSTGSHPSPLTGDMPPPPSYHSVVDPNAPIPNLSSPYDPEEEDDKEDDDTTEITINAATQIRGNGNIISITQMDSMRIANLIGTMMSGGKMQEPEVSQPHPQQAQTMTSLVCLAPEPKTSRQYQKINITVNCGATVIGDRNIVGPGLGDIARQMQAAQRNQALQAQQQQQAQAQARATAPMASNREPLDQAQASFAQHQGLHASQAPTTPMSPSEDLQDSGAGSVKRKADDDGKENAAKRQC